MSHGVIDHFSFLLWRRTLLSPRCFLFFTTHIINGYIRFDCIWIFKCLMQLAEFNVLFLGLPSIQLFDHVTDYLVVKWNIRALDRLERFFLVCEQSIGGEAMIL